MPDGFKYSPCKFTPMAHYVCTLVIWQTDLDQNARRPAIHLRFFRHIRTSISAHPPIHQSHPEQIKPCKHSKSGLAHLLSLGMACDLDVWMYKEVCAYLSQEGQFDTGNCLLFLEQPLLWCWKLKHLFLQTSPDYNHKRRSLRVRSSPLDLQRPILASEKQPLEINTTRGFYCCCCIVSGQSHKQRNWSTNVLMRTECLFNDSKPHQSSHAAFPISHGMHLGHSRFPDSPLKSSRRSSFKLIRSKSWKNL